MSTTLNGNPKTLASNISYMPFGGITGLTYGNGLTLTQTYDNQYRISSIVMGSILNLTFGYDANGNIVSILDTVNPPGGEVFETPGTYTYQTGTNKLTHIEGTPVFDYGYDANGNITSENTRTLVYDLSNQLIQVLDGGVQTAAYTYNGAGQRIKKVTQSETRIFHYDLKGHLIAETNQTGQMLAEYIYLGDQLLSMVQGEQVYYYHNDHLGTPQALSDDTQAIAWKAVYTAFGQAVPSIQTIENPFRFPGQYYDPETGLHYNYFRYYNPQIGRYIAPDPIGLEGGINLFLYVGGNPLNQFDPLGLFESYWFQKWIPGQHFFDLGMTAIEKGQYGWAAAHFAGMLAEDVLFVLTVGQSMAARGAATTCEVGVTSTAGKSGAASFEDATRLFRNGPLTNVGRALIKHPNIIGESGNILQKLGGAGNVNEAAAQALQNIMRNGTMTMKVTKAFGAVIEYKLPSGFGARFSATTGKFIGFLGRGL